MEELRSAACPGCASGGWWHNAGVYTINYEGSIVQQRYSYGYASRQGGSNEDDAITTELESNRTLPRSTTLFERCIRSD
jgi:hypothetical protein